MNTKSLPIFAALLLVSLAPRARAQLIAYEGFAYKDGAMLNGQDGGTGWKGAWFAAEGTKGVVIAEKGMEFPKLAVGGGTCLQDGKDTRIFRHLDTARADVAGL